MGKRYSILVILASVLAISVLMGCQGAMLSSVQYIDRPDYHYRIGLHFLGEGEWKIAQREFRRAVAIDDSYGPAYIGLALVAGYLGDHQQGVEYFQKGADLIKKAGPPSFQPLGEER